MRITAICTLVLVTLLGAPSASGCSRGIPSVEYDSDHVLLVGRISAYRDQLIESRPAIGLEVEPVIVYGQNDPGSLVVLIVVPAQIGIGCEPVGLHPSQDNLDKYAIGNLLGLHVGPYYAGDSNVMYGVPGLSMEEIHSSCDLQVGGQPYEDWDIPRQCGSTYFHAKAVASALSTGSVEEVNQSLRRLAAYPGRIRYEELVNRFVSDEATRSDLMVTRYGDLTHESCDQSTADAARSPEAQFLYREFCALSGDKQKVQSTNDTRQ
jgi:hypothetical protein